MNENLNLSSGDVPNLLSNYVGITWKKQLFSRKVLQHLNIAT